MKLRLADNSLRLRLLRSDVQKLLREGICGQAVSIGGVSLVYALHVSDAPRLRAQFTPQRGRIDVFVPAGEFRDWADSDREGIQGSQIDPDGSLTILIEKDFACMDGSSDSPSHDTFPNPKAELRR